MNVAYEFFKDEEPNIGNDSFIIFFIENYNDFMYFYRVINIQCERTKAKQEKAHKALQRLRDHVEKLQKQKHRFTESEREEILQKTEYYEAIREQPDVIYFNGEPMEHNYVSHIILKYKWAFKSLEKIDRKGRSKLATLIGGGSKYALWPLRKMLKLTMKNGRCSDTVYETINDLHDFVDEVPDKIKKKCRSKIDVDIHSHIPFHAEEEFE